MAGFEQRRALWQVLWGALCIAAVCAGVLLYGALTAWCCERELPRTAVRRGSGLG